MSTLSLAQSTNGKVSGKPWKSANYPANRSNSHPTAWNDRIEKLKKAQAIKKLELELKEEKQAEVARRRQITLDRKKAAEERQRLEEAKAKMGASKAARLRRKAGRTKKING